MQENFSIRRATLDDVEVISQQRRGMFEDMGYTDPAILDAMHDGFVPWLCKKLACEEYVAWLMVSDDQTVVAGVGLWLQDWPPGPRNLVGRRGYVLNVYTHPDYRRRGLARQLMETLIAWSQEQQILILTLHASVDGRHLYETLGFEAHNEMIKRL